MAENEAPQGAPEVDAPQEDAPKETDWKAEARKWESRAKENLSVAKANEDAAKRLAEIEEANKTAEQKQQEKLAEIERENAELKAAAVRAQVMAEKGVPPEVMAVLTGGTRSELEAAADVYLNAQGEQKKQPSMYIPNEGKQPKVGDGSTADQFAAFIENQLS